MPKRNDAITVGQFIPLLIAIAAVACIRVPAFKIHPIWVFAMRLVTAWAMAYAVNTQPLCMAVVFSLVMPTFAWTVDLLDGGYVVYTMISGLLTAWAFTLTRRLHIAWRVLLTGLTSFLSAAIGTVLLALWRGGMSSADALIYAAYRQAAPAISVMAGLCVFAFFDRFNKTPA